MSDLEPAARKLILDVGHADNPSDADQERVRRALAASLGAAAVVTTAVPGAAAVSAGGATAGAAAAGAAAKITSVSQLVLWFSLGAAGGVTVSAAVASIPHEQEPPAALTVPAQSGGRASRAAPATRPVEPTRSPSVEPSESSPLRDVPLVPMVRSDDAVPSSATASSEGPSPVVAFPEPEPSAFAAELRLLERAQHARATGRCDESLRLLAEHSRRFPGGALESERGAVEVHCLCELGRTAEARAALEKLHGAHPESPHVEHLLRSCAGRGRAGGSTIP